MRFLAIETLPENTMLPEAWISITRCESAPRYGFNRYCLRVLVPWPTWSTSESGPIGSAGVWLGWSYPALFWSWNRWHDHRGDPIRFCRSVLPIEGHGHYSAHFP